MGQDGFVWFVGVVEDRNDPSALGRVRVRCLGYHTSSVVDLPTTDLPWAHVMHPVTDPCMHGMGNTPSFLVEGSYVVGFFRDVEKQQLVIMGTLPGVPEYEADPSIGFNDPRSPNAKQEEYKGDPAYGPYPVDNDNYIMKSGHGLYESDTNRLAQGRASETHNSLINRREQRLSGNPSGKLTVSMWTDDPNVAPHFNVNTAYLGCETVMVDYAASAVTPQRNNLVTTPYIADTEADGGTAAAQHMTIPYKLETAATSIVVYMDAVRPKGADFNIYWRTKAAGDDITKLSEQGWTAFSKTNKQVKGLGYFDIAPTDDYAAFREYAFSVFNLNAFDEYQVKITMHTTRQTYPPVFTNLRTIATS